MRTTMDIDANITGMNFEKSAIEEMINKIISIEKGILKLLNFAISLNL